MRLDETGDRMKSYESQYTQLRVDKTKPMVIRLDGKSFHSYTKNCQKPFDQMLMDAMNEATYSLVQLTNADIGYTQSDEISLIFYPVEENSHYYFDGKVLKLASVTASHCSAVFNKEREYFGKQANFDSRVFNLETEDEIYEYLQWRHQDSVGNAISMAAHHLFSHNSLHKVNVRGQMERLTNADFQWDKQPEGCRSGRCFIRGKTWYSFPPEEIEHLPANHAARKDPSLKVYRSFIGMLGLPDTFATATELKETINSWKNSH